MHINSQQLSNLRNLTQVAQGNSRGFTIVELLIVIVIIGVLAAIVIFAYTGLTNRGKQAAAAASATSVQKKIEAYVNDGTTGTYPATFGVLTSTPTATYYINAGSAANQITFKTTAVAATDDTDTINYATCTGPVGYRISYWDAVAGAIRSINGGGATTASSCTIVTS